MEALQTKFSHEHSLLRTLIDNLPDGIYAKDIEGRKVMANSADLEILGCKTLDEALGKTDFDLFPRDIAEGFFADDVSVMKTGKPVTNREEKVILPNGETRWLLTTKVPWRDPSGKIIGLIGIGRNITKHKQAEDALARERKLLRTLVDNLPDGIYAKDHQARKILANPADLKNMGCETEAEAIGKADADLFPPDIAAAFLADDLAVIQGGQAVINREEKVVRPDGETRWLLTSKIPWRTTSGKVLGLVGIGRDITEHKRAEDALARERKLLRTLVDNLPDGIYAKDHQARKILANPADLKNMGCETEAEAIGKADADLFPPDIAAAFLADDLAVIQDGQAVINREEKVVRPDGEIRWLLTSKIPWRTASGKVIGLVGIGRDITEHKQAEDALAHERNLLRTLIDNLPDGIYAKDDQARKILANPADLKNLGCKAEAEAVGKTDAEMFPPDIAEAFLADDLAVIQGGQAVINREEKVVRPNGEVRWLLTSKIPWRNASGKVIGLVGIGRDITDKKNLEAEVQRGQRMESVARLATGIAHDLNNSLAPILVAIELLHAKLEDREGLHVLDTIESSAKRGAEIIKQVLLFSRGLEGRRMPVNLKHLADGVASVASQSLPNNVTIETRVDENINLIAGDPLQLHQALLNLCTNAVEAMPQGGRVGIAAHNVKLDAAFASTHRGAVPGPHVALEVSDTGNGIPASIRDRIFEPFFSTKELGNKSVGMGLSTASSIVKGHRGFITVDSELGKGSAFKIYLPVMEEPPADRLADKQTA